MVHRVVRGMVHRVRGMVHRGLKGMVHRVGKEYGAQSGLGVLCIGG